MTPHPTTSALSSFSPCSPRSLRFALTHAPTLVPPVLANPPQALPACFVWNPLDRRLSRAAQYSYPADVFAAGVSFGELLLGVRHLFTGGGLAVQHDELAERVGEARRRRAGGVVVRLCCLV